MLRIVFMGTPDFAAGILEALIDAGFDVEAAVSQPDKRSGRRMVLHPTPVKSLALSRGICVLQPARASDPDFIAKIREIDPDVIVVAAYGRILGKELLDIPRLGCVNVHASLLPRWRGAAPVQYSLISGDQVSGVSTMLMDEGLDTGAILLQREVAVAKDETGASLFEKLEAIGRELITETLTGYAAGEIIPKPQPAEGVSYAPRITKEMGLIDWSRDCIDIERLVRGLCPSPSAYTYDDEGRYLRITKVRAFPGEDVRGEAGSVDIRDGRLFVCTGRGMIEVLTLQPAGKNPMSAEAFLRGHSLVRFVWEVV